jgi:CBS domain containing-hemolysin-like protein
MLEFSDKTVEEIITPRVKIDALSIDTTVDEAIEFILSKTHSRIPVYR